MRKAGITSIDIVINHAGGPCTGKYSCSMAVQAVLPVGSTMNVWYRNAAGIMQKAPLKGLGRPE